MLARQSVVQLHSLTNVFPTILRRHFGKLDQPSLVQLPFERAPFQTLVALDVGGL